MSYLRRLLRFLGDPVHLWGDEIVADASFMELWRRV